MKRSLISGFTVLFLVALTMGSQAGWNPNAVKEAEQAIAEFKKADSKLQAFFDKSHGYAVFPSVGKGAVGIGGAHGKGTVFEQGVPVGSTSLIQVTIGLALGGQAYRQIIFFKDKATLSTFKAGNFEFSAQASAVAIREGASADADFDKGVAVFTMAKGGAMFEASIGGQKFSYEDGAG